jgi:hypothetical protein
VVADLKDDAGPECAEASARRLMLERLALENQVAAEVEKARARALHTVPVHNQAGNLVDDRANSLASQQASIHTPCLEERTCDRRTPGCILQLCAAHAPPQTRYDDDAQVVDLARKLLQRGCTDDQIMRHFALADYNLTSVQVLVSQIIAIIQCKVLQHLSFRIRSLCLSQVFIVSL